MNQSLRGRADRQNNSDDDFGVAELLFRGQLELGWVDEVPGGDSIVKFQLWFEKWLEF